jgi:HD superfamily phosphohydrolase
MAKYIRDPIWGDIKLEDDEISLVDTPAFQRLRGVKQLGLADVVYPSATHTRFSHSLGTVEAAQTMTNLLGDKINKDLIPEIRMTALLHDIGHLPYSHLLEDESGIFEEKHTDSERIGEFLGQMASSSNVRIPSTVQNILVGEDVPSDRAFIQDMISNTVCADLIDYIQRDGYFTGATGLGFRFNDRPLRYATVLEDHEERLRFVIKPVKDKIRLDVLTDLVQLLRFRYILSERVTFHHAKLAASAMLMKAMEMLEPDVKDFYRLNDNDVFRLLLEKPETKSLAEMIQNRRLYKPVYRATRTSVAEEYSDVDDFIEEYGTKAGRRNLEQMILSSLEDAKGLSSVPKDILALYIPNAAKMNMKETSVLVCFGDDKPFPLKDIGHEPPWKMTIGNEVKALEDKYESLWNAYVCVHPKYADEWTHLIEHVCFDVLGIRNDPLLKERLGAREGYRLRERLSRDWEGKSQKVLERAASIATRTYKKKVEDIEDEDKDWAEKMLEEALREYANEKQEGKETPRNNLDSYKTEEE